jgi:hypothetical protein
MNPRKYSRKSAISLPGAARKRYNSFGSENILVFVLLFLSVNLLHVEFKHTLAISRLAAFGCIAALSSLTPSV